jgi:sec-independent protein translocase protein TatA
MIGDLFDSPWKILIVAVVLIVLFGSRKLPVAARSLGRSMRILKSEVSGLHDDDDEAEQTVAATATVPPTAEPIAPQQIAAAAAVPASAPVAADQSLSAQQPASSQAQIDSLQQQIRELKDLKESPAKQPASVPAEQKPF